MHLPFRELKIAKKCATVKTNSDVPSLLTATLIHRATIVCFAIVRLACLIPTLTLCQIKIMTFMQ